jgi:transposase
MRFVPIKTAEQQSTLVIHRVRETLVGQKTQLINALRGHLAEFGIVAPQGAHKVAQLTMRLADPGDDQVPAAARSVLQVLVDQLRDAGLPSWMPVWSSRPSKTKRAGAWLSVPGLGPIAATALVATIGDGKTFTSGRHLAAWLGLVPRQNSSGGKELLGAISKAKDGYVRPDAGPRRPRGGGAPPRRGSPSCWSAVR